MCSSGALAVDSAAKTRIEPSPQRSGDPNRGYRYLVEGDYLRSGPPIELYRLKHPEPAPNHLNRTGDNATIEHRYTAASAPNGVRIVAPNCLVCHAQFLRGKLIVGLGNSLADFTPANTASVAAGIDSLIIAAFGPDSPQRAAFARFKQVTDIVSPRIRTQVRGVHSADKLAYVLAAHRDPATLQWSDSPLLPLIDDGPAVPTDVPAWWILKKKNALFYTALGRGDFSRIMMASSLLTLNDSSEAARIDARFPDVLAYLNSIQPPKYPGKIDPALALRGKQIFNKHCSDCHGHYGPAPRSKVDYPNLLISLDEIATDPQLARSTHLRYAKQIAGYNASWFGQGPHAAKLVSRNGYVAPPLDGIWATAPYLHNGSVPTLDTLLNSKLRPKFWQRTFDSHDYDLTRIGWNFTLPASGSGNPEIYDTTLPGYANSGHTYGDDLTDDQRRAVIEYLKSL